MQGNDYRRMIAASRNAGWLVLLLMLMLHPALAADADNSSSPKALFESHCSACHSLELPRSQRLDRNTWRWVVDDMVNKFGATWITAKQQDAIIDYLVNNYGPDRPRE